MRISNLDLTFFDIKTLVDIIENISFDFDPFKKEVYLTKSKVELINYIYSQKQFFFLNFKEKFLNFLETSRAYNSNKTYLYVSETPYELKFHFTDSKTLFNLEETFFYCYDFVSDSLHSDLQNLAIPNKSEVLSLFNSICITTNFQEIYISIPLK